MSFALIVIGVAVLLSAINNTWKQLFPQLAKDFFTEGYLYWVAALVIVGFVGYIPGLRKPADAFMTLILVAMLLKNNNVFAQFETAIQNTQGSQGVTVPNAQQNIGGTGINFNGITFSNPTNTGAYSPSNLGATLLANSGVGTSATNSSTSSSNASSYSPSFTSDFTP